MELECGPMPNVMVALPQSREWVTHSDPWPKWPIELLTHDPCDPWPMGHRSRHPILCASLTQIYRLPGTVFGHCICTHTFKLLHNCACKQTARAHTQEPVNLEFAKWKLKHCITTKTGNHRPIHSFILRATATNYKQLKLPQVDEHLPARWGHFL